MMKLEEKLKKHDLRFTEARKLIYNSLVKSSRALTAKDLHEQIKEKADLASIYRNLSLFKEIGIVHALTDGAYSLCEHNHGQDQNHIHIIVNCNQCGLTKEIKKHQEGLCRVTSKFIRHADLLEDFDSIILQGKCKNC